MKEHGSAEHPGCQREREWVLGEAKAEELGETFEAPGLCCVVKREEVLDIIERRQ